MLLMQTPPVKAALEVPPSAPRGRAEGYGRVLATSVTVYLPSGRPIGPLKPPRHAEDWSTSMLRLHVAELLGTMPLGSVHFMGVCDREFVSDNQCVTGDLHVVVSRPE